MISLDIILYNIIPFINDYKTYLSFLLVCRATHDEIKRRTYDGAVEIYYDGEYVIIENFAKYLIKEKIIFPLCNKLKHIKLNVDMDIIQVILKQYQTLNQYTLACAGKKKKVKYRLLSKQNDTFGKNIIDLHYFEDLCRIHILNDDCSNLTIIIPELCNIIEVYNNKLPKLNRKIECAIIYTDIFNIFKVLIDINKYVSELLVIVNFSINFDTSEYNIKCIVTKNGYYFLEDGLYFINDKRHYEKVRDLFIKYKVPLNFLPQ